MKNINDKVFLNKINERINSGDFDSYLTYPFMTRNLLFTIFKGKIDRKIETGGTPILNDAEIKDCISDAEETSKNIFVIYAKVGFINKDEKGTYVLTDKFYLAMKSAYRL